MSNNIKVLKAPLRIAIAILLFGMIAKIVQWPFAQPIIITGFGSLALLYAIRFWKKTEKQFLDYVKLILVLCWTLNGVLRMLHFHYTLIFQLVTVVCFITWFVMEGTAYFMDDDRSAKISTLQIWWNVAMVMGTLSIIIGGLMKILHWQFANFLLVSGIVVVTLYILKDLFTVSKIEESDSGNEELLL